MSETNVSAVMMALNEADEIKACLDSAEGIIDELVLIDGGSDDGTVGIAEDWADRNSKDFQLLESSERELLLEGWGCQRRRGEALATRDYTLALDADVRVEDYNQRWFESDFKHYGYVHTRKRASGNTQSDFRLYCPEPETLDLEFDETPRWRGIIYEEIRTRNGTHISDVYEIAEAPLVVKRHRHAASATFALHHIKPHRHDPRVGGNTARAMKKQHYLMEKAMDSPHERYLSDEYKHYYDVNRGFIKEHWEEIRGEFHLPEDSHFYSDVDAYNINHNHFKDVDLTKGQPIMTAKDMTWLGYFWAKLKQQWTGESIVPTA